jgi:hypothetical protein
MARLIRRKCIQAKLIHLAFFFIHHLTGLASKESPGERKLEAIERRRKEPEFKKLSVNPSLKMYKRNIESY